MGNPGLGAALVTQGHLPEDFSLIARPAWKIVVQEFDKVPGAEHGNVWQGGQPLAHHEKLGHPEGPES